ncbi:hypothetical protein [Candidatus Electronema sp. JC]|uniref:hypothetical protein n=1 Tax=Candidatus Electronema sp. JC TaxID=3401570 RepID=UPI003AA88B90
MEKNATERSAAAGADKKLMGGPAAHRRFCLGVLGTVGALFSSLLLYGFLFDPWQLFHQPWFRETVFINNARFQNAGLINSHEFDSAILGNSMAENFSAAEAGQELGGRFVNLSMAGSLFSERQIVLEHLLRKKNIKQVIISLDHLPFVRAGQYSQDLPPERFAFLYNRNPFDDFRLYFDIRLLRCWNFSRKNSCWEEIPGTARVKSLEELYQWFPYYVKAFGGIKAWCGWSKKSPPFKAFLDEIIRVADIVKQEKKDVWQEQFLAECRNNSRSSFEQHLLPIVTAHPETEFLFFFPPYSRLWYAMQEQYYVSYYKSYQLFIEDVVRAAGNLPNVRIFGFDNQDFTADIANYKDQSHYHKDINAKLLRLMAEGRGLLRAENLDAYLQEIAGLAADYDLRAISAELQSCMN